jgi:hypothetical protein
MRIIKPDAKPTICGVQGHRKDITYYESDTIEISDAQLETIYYGYKGYFDAVVLVGREPITFPQYFGKRIISLAGEGKE